MTGAHGAGGRGSGASTQAIDQAIDALHRGRPRNRLLRVSVALLGVIVVCAWAALDLHVVELQPRAGVGLFGEFARQLDEVARRLTRFGNEIRPYPLRGEAWDWSIAATWARDLVVEDGWIGSGWDAAVTTLAMSVLAIVIAGASSALAAPFAASTVAAAEPFLPGPAAPGPLRRYGWRAVALGTRAVLIFLRAIPEYVWAFLLIQIFGFSAWPAVLALALHNIGIMGRLTGETVENLHPKVLAHMRGLGATRVQIVLFGVYPAALPRWLLYFFYRWETCVREATVLGMLGVVSLGYLIKQTRAAYGREDEMVFYILLGGALVLIGDVVSAVVRRFVREAR